MKTFVGKLVDSLHIPLWLFILFIILFIMRVPSFFEPYWYGDEAIYLTLGEGIRQGFLLYRDIHDNKPPFIYILTAIAGNLFWFKAILATWTLTTTFFFWKLARTLWPNKKQLTTIAVVIFGLLTTIPLLEGNIANGEIFMIGPTILAFYLILSRKNTFLIIFTAGVIFSIGILFKATSFFDLGAILVLWLVMFFDKKFSLKQVIVKGVVLLIGVAMPFFITLLFFWSQEALSSYIMAIFSQNVSYLSSWRSGWDSNENLFTQNSPLFIRLAIVVAGVGGLILLYLKRIISQPLLFVTLWFLTSLFAALLSERPYPHYILQVVPPLSFLIANVFSDKTQRQFVSYPFFALLGIALVNYRFYYYPVTNYYTNFISWATQNKTTTEYFKFFDSRTPRNYELVTFLSQSIKPEDKIFVWGNDTEIYALSRRVPPTRYVSAYHIIDFNAQQEVLEKLQKEQPKYIITTAAPYSFPELAMLLNSRYVALKYVEDAIVWLLVAKK